MIPKRKVADINKIECVNPVTPYATPSSIAFLNDSFSRKLYIVNKKIKIMSWCPKLVYLNTKLIGILYINAQATAKYLFLNNLFIRIYMIIALKIIVR